MVYTAEEIVRDVRVALDLNDVPTQLVLDADIETLTTEEVIRSKIGDAAVRVLSEAPPTLLDGGHGFADSVFWGADGCGWTLLPSDFLRLIVFEMSDWEKPVTSPISEFDAAYTLQRSRHKGLRGTPQLPVCAVVMRPEGKALEFYACADNTAGRVTFREVYTDRERVSERTANTESKEQTTERTAAREDTGKSSVTEQGKESKQSAGGVSSLRFALYSLAVACAALLLLWWLITHKK